MKLNSRIYHPYNLWEEVAYNMWGSTKDKNHAIAVLVAFMSDTSDFSKWMNKVVDDWKYSCEHNLSNTSSNRKAWIGQAACAYKFKISEDVVRSAWFMITDKQREHANAEADKAIKKWEMEKWLS